MITEKADTKKGKDTELTPEIVNLIKKYHNAVAGHVGENKTMGRLKGAYSNGLISQCPSKEQVKTFMKLCTGPISGAPRTVTEKQNQVRFEVARHATCSPWRCTKTGRVCLICLIMLYP